MTVPGIFPLCHWAGGVGTLFNGIDNNLRRGALSGVSSDKLGLLFISFKPSAFNDVVFNAAGIKITWGQFLGQNRITINIGTNILTGVADTNVLDNNEWGTLLIEFDMDDFGSPPGEVHVARVYINDTPDVFVTQSGNHGIVMPSSSSLNRIASAKDDTSFFSGCIEKVWFSVGENVDLTVPSNRLKWYNADLTPKDLGSTGQDPTGNTPAIYMQSDTGEITTNLGTGGSFSLFGPGLTECSTNPTDNPPDA